MSTSPRDLATSPAGGIEPVPRRALWFGAFGAASAWSIQLVACVAVGGTRCLAATGPVGRSDAAWWAVLVVSVVALTVSIASTSTAARCLTRARSAGEEHEPGLVTRVGRARLMALGGLLLDGVFVIGVAFNLLAVFVVPLCR